MRRGGTLIIRGFVFYSLSFFGRIFLLLELSDYIFNLECVAVGVVDFFEFFVVRVRLSWGARGCITKTLVHGENQAPRPNHNRERLHVTKVSTREVIHNSAGPMIQPLSNSTFITKYSQPLQNCTSL